MFANSVKTKVRQLFDSLLARNHSEVEAKGKELGWGGGTPFNYTPMSTEQIFSYQVGTIQLYGDENNFAYVLAPTETGTFSLEDLRDGVELHRDLARVTKSGLYFRVCWNQRNYWAIDIHQESGPSYWGARNSTLATIVRNGDRHFTGPGFTPFLVTFVGYIEVR